MRILPSLSAGLLLALGACAPQPPGDDVPRSAAPADAPDAHAVLPWIADDYPAALAEARERDLPVFVESWAPW